MATSNRDLIRRLFDAYARRDRAAAGACLHPEVEWYTIAGPVFGVEVVHGREALLTFLFDQIPEEMPDFVATLEEMLECDADHVLVIAHYVGHGVSSQAPVEMTTAGLYGCKNGLIASCREFSSRAEALRAAGGLVK